MIRKLLFGALAATCLMISAPSVRAEVWQKKQDHRVYYSSRRIGRPIPRYYYHTWSNPVYYGGSGVYYYGINPATPYEDQSFLNPLIYSPNVYSPEIYTGPGFVSGWLF